MQAVKYILALSSALLLVFMGIASIKIILSYNITNKFIISLLFKKYWFPVGIKKKKNELNTKVQVLELVLELINVNNYGCIWKPT